MEFREQEVMSLPGADERWENWYVAMIVVDPHAPRV